MAKILLADDSGTAQRMGAQILSAEGHEVATVSNGQAAIKMLSEFSPDLIVADVFMPGKTGYELCEFVKSDPASAWIPVLLIVAPMEPYDATEGQRVKADGLVTKPLDKSNLVETVQTLLASIKKPASTPKKRGAKAAAAPPPAPPPEPAETHELPAEEDLTIPAITSPVTAEIDIPEEMKNQPVSLVSELLEPTVVEKEPSVETEPEQVELGEIEREIPDEEDLANEPAPVSILFKDEPSEIVQDPLLVSGTESIQPEGMARLFADAEKFEQDTPLPEESGMDLPTISNEELAAQAEPAVAPEPPPASPEPSPEPSPESSWTAEAAAVLEDDKKLFGSEPPDWQGLVNLVQEAEQQGEFPAVASAAAPEPPSEVAHVAPSPETPEPAPTVPPQEEQAEAGLQPAAAEETPTETAAAPTAARKAVKLGDTIEKLAPPAASLDYAAVEQIVRETLEEIMPQIVERVAQATGLRLQKKDEKAE